MSVINSWPIRILAVSIGMVTGLLSWQGRGADVMSVVAISIFYSLLAWNAVIDAYTKTLVVLVSNCALIIALLADIWRYGWDLQWWYPLAGALLICCLPLWILSSATSGTVIGIGDVRLLVVLVCWHGLKVLPVLIIAVVCAGCVGVVGLLSKRLKLSSTLPFGPFLVAASWVVSVGKEAVNLAQSVI
ncbi:prepilin peptidase [Arcanobacterium pinnipediorum]|uniref:Prepilin type IV endopeptidase peptidase domain-containing protein n=1 Tax=Arcanobacterium pinnipediorum TaxID=1503041 RepID=A0ABY5AK86_9ACTO|nr:prepilin peptidase [Arcanobacterium pinnipediorum]USR80186.1 hypothetical protein NG665_04235 [Arcanobacterium pinnipediorum]